jgi:hypothetical protein
MGARDGQSMSQMATGVFGAFVVSLACGAVQLASGHDLTGLLQERLPGLAGTADASVNRAAKADRAAGVTGPAVSTRTISLRLNGLADTSILVRIPVERGGSEGSSAPSVTKSSDRKATVACEPVVSALTEVAKRLQPGRCLT